MANLAFPVSNSVSPDVSQLVLQLTGKHDKLRMGKCNMSSFKRLQTLKDFVNDFNYPEPLWDNLPEGFPGCDTKGLTPHEEGLYSAIVLIWYANHGGRTALYGKITRSLILIMAMVVSGFMIKNILVSDMFGRVVTVNAATVSGTLRTITPKVADENYVSPGSVLESTVSGLLRSESKIEK